MKKLKLFSTVIFFFFISCTAEYIDLPEVPKLDGPLMDYTSSTGVDSWTGREYTRFEVIRISRAEKDDGIIFIRRNTGCGVRNQSFLVSWVDCCLAYIYSDADNVRAGDTLAYYRYLAEDPHPGNRWNYSRSPDQEIILK